MKIGIVSLGCPKNLVDSEVMLGLAERSGHTVTSDPADADALVVNTCAFIGPAKEESIDAILELAVHRRTGRCRRLIVAGCLAERYREELRLRIPEVDVVLGTNEVPGIVSALEGVQPQSAATSVPTYLYDYDTPRRLATPRHYAYVKIAEGCDYSCSFCVIPALRGRYRSRSVDSIVAEAEILASAGVREIILVSQDTTFYGIDRGDRAGLSTLLRRLDKVAGLLWLRLLYLFPTTLTDDILNAMAESEKVCRYIDLPLQHAADRVLQRMRRPGSRRSYETLLRRVRGRMPDVTLRSSFIVGFPGETAEDFDALVSFVRGVGFDHLGVFEYSHEEGTAAWNLEDDVKPRVKRRRRSRLMELQREIVAAAQTSQIGSKIDVLVDGPSAEHELVVCGRTRGQAPDIDSVVYLTDCVPEAGHAGKLIRALVVDSRGYDMVARPLLV
jgi:ribosomal protein S12 methylthiotransferase